MRSVATACLTLSIMATAGNGPSWAADSGARLAVEPASFDFGRVRADSTVEKEFRLRNFGAAELVIERVTTSCGCTVAEGYDKRLAPGKSTTLRAKLQTRSQPGHVVRSLLIHTNDAEKPAREIKLEATVVAAER